MCPYSTLTFGPSHEAVSLLFGCCCGSQPESVRLLESCRTPPCETTTSCFPPSSATTSLCCVFCLGLGPLTTNSVHLGDPHPPAYKRPSGHLLTPKTELAACLFLPRISLDPLDLIVFSSSPSYHPLGCCVVRSCQERYLKLCCTFTTKSTNEIISFVLLKPEDWIKLI